MDKVSEVEVRRGREFLKILIKVDEYIGRIGIRLILGILSVVTIIGIIVMRIVG